ncbi:MAG: thiamine phosphate synthase [Treponema sp.]|jgi:thiamine-phosphate pyrophosphorylase|nr:thiamine phosphate synthase [Treponema sp.]
MLDPPDLLLYLCMDKTLIPGRPIIEVVEEAIAGGVTMVQLREKEAATGEFYRIAREVQAVTQYRHVPLVINGRLDIALAVDADGLHIERTDMPLSVARHIAGDNLFIGFSASTVEDALLAQTEGADYLSMGTVYPAGNEADTEEALMLEKLAEIRAAVKIPVVGTGGINADNAAEVMKTGAAGAAIASGILSQPDIKEAARKLRRILDEARLY